MPIACLHGLTRATGALRAARAELPGRRLLAPGPARARPLDARPAVDDGAARAGRAREPCRDASVRLDRLLVRRADRRGPAGARARARAAARAARPRAHRRARGSPHERARDALEEEAVARDGAGRRDRLGRGDPVLHPARAPRGGRRGALRRRPDGRLQARVCRRCGRRRGARWRGPRRRARGECPTLVVTGARSWLPVDVGRLAPARHVEVPGGHTVLWDDLDADRRGRPAAF